MFGSSVCNTLILTTMKSEFTEENSNGTVPTDYIYSDFNISNNIICDIHSQENKKTLADIVLYCISFLISICSYIAISNKQT